MKTNRATGFALVAAFSCFGGLAIMPGCSGNQADVTEPLDSGVGDGSVVSTVDSGTTADTGSTGAVDTGTGTTTDTGTGTTTDTGTGTTTDTGTGTDTDSGACPPASCTADSDCGCLTASGSIGCCDTVTMACFQSASSQCPDVGVADAGTGTGY